jgi:hypothetical protein
MCVDVRQSHLTFQNFRLAELIFSFILTHLMRVTAGFVLFVKLAGLKCYRLWRGVSNSVPVGSHGTASKVLLIVVLGLQVGVEAGIILGTRLI